MTDPSATIAAVPTPSGSGVLGASASRRGASSSPIPRRTRRPSWLDLRLVLGVALVLTAVLIGASVVSSADHRTSVWAVRHDLAAGTVLRAGDLRVVRAQLGEARPVYLAGTDQVVGKVLQASVRAGELLPHDAVTTPPAGLRVSVPLTPGAAPELTVGDRIVLWVTTKACRGVVLLAGAVVQQVSTTSAGSLAGGGTTVELSLPPADAARVMSAMSVEGVVLRAGVLAGSEAAPPIGDELVDCLGGS